MSVVKYDYLPAFETNLKTGEVFVVYRPYVPLILCMNHKVKKDEIACLLDSGADRNIFPAAMAESLGVDITKGKKVLHYGIGKGGLIAYAHKVKLYLGNYGIDTEVDFSIDHDFPLVGRQEFFRFFKRVSILEKGKFGIDGYTELEH